jgi:hypothetical protein
MSESKTSSKGERSIPESYCVGQELDWNAPWIDVSLWVELPFWLMLDNATFVIEIDGHKFSITTYDNLFELYGQYVTDSKATAGYLGPYKKFEELNPEIQQARKNNPNMPFIWRKCKTVLKIKSRCNKDIWNAAIENKGPRSNSAKLYFSELCKTHIQVVNRLIQAYRLATYDYLAFEVAGWDVPHWKIVSGTKSISSLLLPYRGWDVKPSISKFGNPSATPVTYQLIQAKDFCEQIETPAAPGELDLLDALNFVERGNYSDAVRRITTAIEVLVEALVGKAVEATEGKETAEKFLERTKNKFNERVAKYEEITGRKLSDPSRKHLYTTRKLRNRIVHDGYRISPSERGMAHRSVDTGRWLFNWFENDAKRQNVREGRIAFRTFGLDRTFGIFPAHITPEGVVVLPIPQLKRFARQNT